MIPDADLGPDSDHRCDELEMTLPALVFRLYRLLMVIGERRLQDHRLRLVAAEAFKVTRAPHPTFAPTFHPGLWLSCR
jgi:hypothetical protein